MSYWVYILQSESTGKLYTGQTSDIRARTSRHNSDGQVKTRYTYKHKGPWSLIHSEEHETRSEAMKREKFLKAVKEETGSRKTSLISRSVGRVRLWRINH